MIQIIEPKIKPLQNHQGLFSVENLNKYTKKLIEIFTIIAPVHTQNSTPVFMKKIFAFALFVFSAVAVSFAQSPLDKIDPEAFNPEILVQPIIDGLNGVRWAAGADSMISNDILANTAAQLAADYAGMKKIQMDPEITSKYNKKNGGTIKVEEVAIDVSSGKSKAPFTYAQVAQDIVDKIKKSKKFAQVTNNPKYFYIGVGSEIIPETRKIYVSVVVGGIDAFNKGAEDRNKLAAPYSTKKYGLFMYDEKTCKVCDKFTELPKLEDHIYMKDGLIYLETDNLKQLKKYFKNPKDGFAIDIVQKSQYPCNSENIFDNNLLTRGITTKPIYTKKILKNNELLKDDPKTNSYKGVIGKVPGKLVPNIDEDYELNLIYIVDKTLCKTIRRSYLEDGGMNSITPLNIYPDTVTMNDPKRYTPQAENQTLEFIIPFEQGKSTYKTEDIAGFLEALNEPKYIINEVNITAHSSLEGDSTTNAKLQKNRAQSIIDALEKYQNQEVTQNIITSDSWDMFVDSIKKTQYADWASMSKQDVKSKLHGDVLNELEDLLSNERFAKIEMKVTYDITGGNEQVFVLSQYKKALDKKDYPKALSIQKYIVDQIMSKKYAAADFLAITIPTDAPKSASLNAYASLLVNTMFIDNHFNHADSITTTLQSKFDAMAKTYPNNDFVVYNKYMSFVKAGTITDKKQTTDIQNNINMLYNKQIPQNMNDALNLEFQFKILAKVDTLDPGVPNADAQACMDRIKKIFNLEESNWQNSLQLAYIFQKHGDLAYSMKLLEPYVTDETPNEDLLFTYIALAAHFQDQIFSRNFRVAMQKASVMDATRYCDLFGYPNLTFQVMDNPLIKNQFCNTCGN